MSEADNPKTCKTCRHGQSIRVPSRGNAEVVACRKIMESITACTENRWMIEPQYYEDAFVVPDEFGCNQWSRKDENEKPKRFKPFEGMSTKNSHTSEQA